MATAITEPGLYYDMPVDVYHADPVPGGSLSATRAKLLLDEGGPAKFRHRADRGQEPRAEFDMGHAAHALVLGKDADALVLIDADSWRSKDAREARDVAHAAGKTPLLPSQMRIAEDMAEALTRNRYAVESLQGEAEVSMFWKHHTGLWLRGRADVIGECIGDYKTTADASAYGFTKAVWRYRYHMQAAWYRALHLWITGTRLPYRLVAQEKTAPYLVSVWEPTEDYLALGFADMTDAIATYLTCLDEDRWPGYPDEVQILTPPEWAYDDDIEAEE